MPDSELGGVEEGVNVPQRENGQMLLKRPVGISGTDGAGRAFLEDAMEGSPRSQKSRLEATMQRRKQQEQTQGKCRWKARGLENSPHAQLASD